MEIIGDFHSIIFIALNFFFISKNLIYLADKQAQS